MKGMLNMLKISKAIIVEGKYDKIKLESLVDTVIVQTNGFSVFRDKEKLALIRRLAEECGVIILTDSDAAGFKIRAFLGGMLPKSRVLHVNIPDIPGKEKRKEHPSAAGTLGVEGIDADILREMFAKAGILPDGDALAKRSDITTAVLYEDGFVGAKDSATRRRSLQRLCGLPAQLSKNGLCDALSRLFTLEQYKDFVKKIDLG